MDKYEIKRIATGPDGTFGVFVCNNEPLCLTCENAWRDNKKALSCIPDGKYLVTKHSGTRYKDVWKLNNVPGRSAILIHWGNTEADTDGCVLVGNSFANFNGVPGIKNSKATIDMLRKKLPKEFELVVTGLSDLV